MNIPCLTVHQPWASLIACEAKQYETRSWQPGPRLPPGSLLAIHASKQDDNKGFVLMGREAESMAAQLLARAGVNLGRPLPTGKILCVCRFSLAFHTNNCYRRSDEWQQHHGHIRCIEDDEWLLGDFSPGRYAWELEVVEVLDPPIPARGRQRLWDWEPPAGLTLPPARSDD